MSKNKVKNISLLFESVADDDDFKEIYPKQRNAFLRLQAHIRRKLAQQQLLHLRQACWKSKAIKRFDAARCIQSAYRGYRVRTRILRPPVQIIRTLDGVAASIQAAWRVFQIKKKSVARKIELANQLVIERRKQQSVENGHARERKKFNLAANSIQRVFRGHKARLRASLLKAWYEQKENEDHLMQRKLYQASATIQRVWRGYICRQRIRPLIEWHADMQNPVFRATVVLQAAWRGYLGRQEAAAEREWQTQKQYIATLKAAVDIQRVFRAHKARKYVQQYRIERQARLVHMHNVAASNIQRVWHGHEARKIARARRYDVMWEEEQRQHQAAVDIQRVYRAFKGRQYVSSKSHQLATFLLSSNNQAALTIQCMYRCFQARKTLKKLLRWTSARKIQCQWRIRVARRKYIMKKRDKSVRKIEEWRAYRQNTKGVAAWDTMAEASIDEYLVQKQGLFGDSKRLLNIFVVQKFMRTFLSVSYNLSQVLLHSERNRHTYYTVLAMQEYWQNPSTRKQLVQKRDASLLLQRVGRGHQARKYTHVVKVCERALALQKLAEDVAAAERAAADVIRLKISEDKRQHQQRKQQHKATRAARRQEKAERQQQLLLEQDRKVKMEQKRELEAAASRTAAAQGAADAVRMTEERRETPPSSPLPPPPAAAQQTIAPEISVSNSTTAAERIQRMMRVHFAKKRTNRARKARRLCRRSEEQMLAVQSIQRVFRGHHQRLVALHHHRQREHIMAIHNTQKTDKSTTVPEITICPPEAASTIQRMIRSRLARKITNRARKQRLARWHNEEKQLAVSNIQRLFRGHTGRLLALQCHKAEKVATKPLERTEIPPTTTGLMITDAEAASRIQRVQRTYVAKKKAVDARQKRTERRRTQDQKLAATKIQKVMRGKQVRSKIEAQLAHREAATMLIQRVGRGHLSRYNTLQTHSSQTKAATTIQRTFRGFHGRNASKQRKVQLEDEKLLSLSFSENNMSGVEETRRVLAAIHIQRVWRGCRVRSKLAKQRQQQGGGTLANRNTNRPPLKNSSKNSNAPTTTHPISKVNKQSYYPPSPKQEQYKWQGFAGDRNLTEAEKRKLIVAVGATTETKRKKAHGELPEHPPPNTTTQRSAVGRRVSGLKNGAIGPVGATTKVPSHVATSTIGGPKPSSSKLTKQQQVLATMPPRESHQVGTKTSVAVQLHKKPTPQIGYNGKQYDTVQYDFAGKIKHMNDLYQKFMTHSVHYSQHGQLFLELEQMSKHTTLPLNVNYDNVDDIISDVNDPPILSIPPPHTALSSIHHPWRDSTQDDIRSIGSSSIAGPTTTNNINDNSGGGNPLPPIKRAAGYGRGKHLHAVQQRNKTKVPIDIGFAQQANRGQVLRVG